MAQVVTQNIESEILIEDTLVENLPLISLSVSNEINRIPRAKLQVHYRRMPFEADTTSTYQFQEASNFNPIPTSPTPEFKPGQKIEIKLGEEDKTESVFVGYITKHRIEANNNGSFYLFIECKHIANQLTINKRTRVLHHFDDQAGVSSDGTINKIDELSVLQKLVKKGSGDALDLKWDNDVQSLKQENLIQYEVSDWDFVLTRAEIHGLVCIANSNELKLTSPKIQSSTDLEITLGENLLQFEAEFNEVQRAKNYTFANWVSDADQQNELDQKNQNVESNTSKIQSDVEITYSAELEEQELNALQKNLEQRQEAGLMEGTATVSGTNEFKLLDTISLKGFNAPWDQNTIISGIKHVFKHGTWHTHLQCGISPENHQDTYQTGGSNGSNPFIPSSSALIYGKINRYVTSSNGNEMAEISITSASNEEDHRTIYARLSSFAAGSKAGAVFRPAENDEVIVGFINSDPRFPVILGCTYNSSNESPYALESEGGELVQQEVGFSFYDGWNLSLNSKEKTMSLSTPKGQKFELAADDQEQSITMLYDDSNSIVIDKDGVKINASKISLKSEKGDIEIDSMNTKINATVEVDIQGSQFKAAAKATAEVSGSITQVN